MSEQQKPPAKEGWYFMLDRTYDIPQWEIVYLYRIGVKVLMTIYTPSKKIREWPMEYDGEDWQCASDDGYTEVEPIDWIGIDFPIALKF